MGVAAQILTLLAFAAGGGDPPAPRTEITPILHTGDPAPGIPDATMVWMGIPEIDAVGNMLIYGFFQIDGQATAHTAIWYGGAGTLEPIAYDDMQAPDLPPGMVFDYLLAGRLSESGWIGYRANLKGPGIVPGVNDMANFAGPPGDIRNILQGGDPAPGLEPGTVIDVSEGFGLTAWLSDNASLLVIAWLSGPDVDESNDRAIWIGPRDDLQLVWREGMEASGTEPGVTFDWSDLLAFNDAQITFRGGLVGDSIDESNDVGRWLGSSGNLSLVTRAGDPAPGFGPGIILAGAGGGFTTMNALGYTTELTLLEGPGIDEDNNLILYVGQPGDLEIVRREGDPAPEAGPDVEIDHLGNQSINSQGEIFYSAKYRGASIDETNQRAMYFGPFDDPHMTLRDGDPAPQFPNGIVLAGVGGIPGRAAMNDVGGIIAPSEIVGDDVTPLNNVVLWMRDPIRADWFPLLRAGMEIEGGILLGEFISSYGNKTGGSDGREQSFNDAAQLVARLEFLDGTHAVFLLEFKWAGDHDGDSDVDFADFGSFQICFRGDGVGFPDGCSPFDFDDDEDVDLFDLECFLGATTGPR